VADRYPRGRNDAFAGRWMSPRQQEFEVYYMDRSDARRQMEATGKVHQHGHPLHVSVGWRWRLWDPQTEADEQVHGPFSSSRTAYKDAMEVLK
jgi:hypothetical protein